MISIYFLYIFFINRTSKLSPFIFRSLPSAKKITSALQASSFLSPVERKEKNTTKKEATTAILEKKKKKTGFFVTVFLFWLFFLSPPFPLFSFCFPLSFLFVFPSTQNRKNHNKILYAESHLCIHLYIKIILKIYRKHILLFLYIKKTTTTAMKSHYNLYFHQLYAYKHSISL